MVITLILPQYFMVAEIMEMFPIETIITTHLKRHHPFLHQVHHMEQPMVLVHHKEEQVIHHLQVRLVEQEAREQLMELEKEDN